MPFQEDTSGQDRNVPTAAAGAGAGTSPPAPVMGAQSSDARGSLTFGTGTVPAAGILVTVTFARPHDASRPPVVQIEPTTQPTAGIDLYVVNVVSGAQVTGFQVGHNTRLAGASQGNTVFGFSWLTVD